MTARDLTKALRGHWHGTYGLCLCPCHDDGKTPALKVSDDPRKDDGIDLHCFAGCDWRDVKTELRRRGLIPERDGAHKQSWRRRYRPRQTARVSREQDNDARSRAAAALRIWSKSRPSPGTPAETYLASRGITIPPPPTLRYHPGLRHRPTGLLLPAMIAAITVWPSHQVVAVHRTFLTADGSGKAPVTQAKMMLGPCAGGAVRLVVGGDDELVLAEGLETALSILQATGRPIWATLSTSGLKSVILPHEVKSITIAADSDEPGLKAAYAAAEKWTKAGRTVRVAVPPEPGTDFNDMAMSETMRTAKEEAA